MKLATRVVFGAACLAIASLASADQQPLELTDQQMEGVNAGIGFAAGLATAEAYGGAANLAVSSSQTAANPHAAASVTTSLSVAGP